MGFVQFYFGLPLASSSCRAVFVPIYRRLGVYTAYEFLGRRFDAKTRLLGAGLFLLQRGLAAGITIYAPAIILSTVLGWRARPRHRVHRAARDRLHRHRRQRGGQPDAEVADGGDLRRHGDGRWSCCCAKLPDGLGFSGAAHVAGALGKLKAVDFSLDPSRRYTFWSGIIGGFFLALSYFGTDQSQVQRYLGGASVARKPARADVQRRAEDPDAVLHPAARRAGVRLLPVRTRPCSSTRPSGAATRRAQGRDVPRPRRASTPPPPRRARRRSAPGSAPARRDDAAARSRRARRLVAANQRTDAVRAEAKAALAAADPRAKTKDSDYVFITFILTATAARGGRAAGRGDVRRRAVIEGRRARRARLHHARSTSGATSARSPPHDEARNVRVAQAVHRALGRRSRSASRSSPASPRTSSRRSTSSARSSTASSSGSSWWRSSSGAWAAARSSSRAVTAQTLVIAMYFSLEHRLPLVQPDRLRRVHRLERGAAGGPAPRAAAERGRAMNAPKSRPFPAHLGHRAPHVEPVIAFGQQPCGFFPRRFLVAKIRTARRLQAEIGGRIVFFCHDSDHDPRETRTDPAPSHDRTSRRSSTSPSRASSSASSRRSTPSASPPDWHARTLLQLANYVDRPVIDVFRKTSAETVSDFCLEMYRAHGPARRRSTSCARAIRRCGAAPATWTTSSWTCRTRARSSARACATARCSCTRAATSTLTLPATAFAKEQISPTRDTRLRWMQSVIHCTHYVAGAGEQRYLRTGGQRRTSPTWAGTTSTDRMRPAPSFGLTC